MSKDIKYTLENNGINTDRYLSLRINKDDLPDGAEVVLAVVDADGNTRPLTNVERRSSIAKSSRFYGQIMADGYIFNPYSHRRYIAAQFKRLIKQFGFAGIAAGVVKCYNWEYAIDFLRKEVHKLKNLHKHDLDAFEERSQFFTLNACAEIISDYVEAVHEYLDATSAQKSGTAFYVRDYGMVQKGNLRPMKYRFTQLAAMARECKTYAKMDRLLDAFDWLELPKKGQLTDAFVKPYIEAGAYYTLKHDMMFEGLQMYHRDQQNSLQGLRQYRYPYVDLAERLL